MRRFTRCLLPVLFILAGCTGKDIRITEPVNLNLKIDRVKANKVAFTVTCNDPNAQYTYAIQCLDDNPAVAAMSKRELAEYILSLEKQDYEVRDGYIGFQANLVDVTCFRGSRSLKYNHLAPDTNFRLIVFQVNPDDFTPLGDILTEDFRTRSIEKADLSFTFSLEGTVLTITPSDNGLSYYWDYESEDRIYDDYMGPENYFFSIVDMYEDYGFMKNVVLRGPVSYDLSKDKLKEGVRYIVVAAGYDTEQEEINTDYHMMDF